MNSYRNLCFLIFLSWIVGRIVQGFDVSSSNLIIEDYSVLTPYGAPISFWKNPNTGDLYGADISQNKIFKVSGFDYSVSVFAGNGQAVSSNPPNGIDVRGTAIFGTLYEIWGDLNFLYYCDALGMVRKISLTTYTLGSLAGGGNMAPTSSYQLATNLYFNQFPISITGVESLDTIFIGDNGFIYWLQRSTGKMMKYVGGGFDTSPGPTLKSNARLSFSGSIKYDPIRNVLYFSDYANRVIRQVSLSTQMVTTIAGKYGIQESVQFTNGNLAKDSLLYYPNIIYYASDVLYFTEYYGFMLNAIDLNTGKLYRIAGTLLDSGPNVVGGTLTNDQLLGMNGPASQAKFKYPYGIYVDEVNDSVLISDSGHKAVRKISPSAAYSSPTYQPTNSHGGSSSSSSSSQANASGLSGMTVIIIAVVVSVVVVVVIALLCCLFYFTRVKEYPTIDFTPPPSSSQQQYPNASAPSTPSAPVDGEASIEMNRGKAAYQHDNAPIATEVQLITDQETVYGKQQPYVTTAVMVQSNQMSV